MLDRLGIVLGFSVSFAVSMAACSNSTDANAADDAGSTQGVDGAPGTPGADATAPTDAPGMVDGATPAAAGRGFPNAGPWVSFYGPASGVDVAKVASTFRIINIDADPGAGNFTDAEITTLKGGGQNRVISYLNVGSCEMYRTYWQKCVSTGALTTLYDGYPDEKWANLSNVAYQDLVVNEVAATLANRKVDGFFLDNLEVVEHGAGSTNGPCDATCAQGGLDLVWKLRQKFPGLLIVMQNATGAFTRTGTTHGVSYPSLLDGISHEDVYSNGGDAQARTEMLAWRALGLTVGGHPFWTGVEDYVGACSSAKKSEMLTLKAQADADGLSSYVTDESGQQLAPCYWGEL
jgi:cysteinyl-tRNA synthetase